jgi:hypothetical protein
MDFASILLTQIAAAFLCLETLQLLEPVVDLSEDIC